MVEVSICEAEGVFVEEREVGDYREMELGWEGDELRRWGFRYRRHQVIIYILNRIYTKMSGKCKL